MEKIVQNHSKIQEVKLVKKPIAGKMGTVLTNDELLQQVKKDLKNDYNIGLHAINTDDNKRYISYLIHADIDKVNYHEWIYTHPDVNCNVTEEDVIVSILKKGLTVPRKSLLNTVKFITSPDGNFKSEVFNYNFQDPYLIHQYQKTYNIIIAIPKFVIVNGVNYFLGDVNQKELNDVMTNIVFANRVPNAFIYGYYRKDYNPEFYDDLEGVNDKRYFRDDLIFNKNQKHYSFQNSQEKSEIFINYLTKINQKISLLQDIDPSSIKDQNLINTQNEKNKIMEKKNS